MANDGMIEFLTPDALAQLKEASAIVDKLVPQIEKISKFKAPTTPSGADNSAKQMEAALIAQEKAMEKARIGLQKLSDAQKQAESKRIASINSEWAAYEKAKSKEKELSDKLLATEIANAEKAAKAEIDKNNKITQAAEKRAEKEKQIEDKKEAAILASQQRQLERQAKIDARNSRTGASSAIPGIGNKIADIKAAEKEALALEKAALGSQKLNDAYGKLNASRNQAARTLQNLIASETASNAEIRKAQREFDTLNAKVKKADQAVGNFSRNVGNYGSALSGVTQLMGAFGIATGLALGANIIKDIFQTTKELQSLDLALKMVSETQDKYAANTSFVRELSERWGIEIKGLTEQFTQFYVNAKGKLSEDAIRTSFEGIAKAGSLMGISIDKQNDAFYAFNQMLSKGTVQAEELKKQLGNALPGAIKAATMAYQELNPNLKVTEQMMLDQMKAGKLVSTEMVPAIIRAYQKLYGIENVNGVNTLAAAHNRLNNSWTEMIRNMNETSTDGVGKWFDYVLKGLNFLIVEADRFINSWDTINKKAAETGAARGKKSFSEDITKATSRKDEETIIKFTQESTLTAISRAEGELKDVEEYLKELEEWSAKNIAQAALGIGLVKRRNANFRKEDLIEEIAYLKAKANASKTFIKDREDKLKAPKAEVSDKTLTDEEIAALKKAKKERLPLTFKEIESEYNLKIAILERKKAENTDDDQTSYEERIAKRIAFSEASIEIIDMQLQKEYALYEFKRNEDYAKNDLALKNKEISLEQHSINKDDIINTYINKSLTAEIKASDDIKALQKQDFNFFKNIKYKQQDEVLKLNKLITNGEIAKYKIITDNEYKTLVVREAAFQAYIQLEKDLLEAQKISDVQRAESRGASKEEIAAITAEYENAIAALGNIKSPKILAIEQVTAEMKQIASSFASDAGFGATFKLLQEGLDKYGDNVAAKTVVIMEAFQEMYNFINKMSQENFDAEYKRLEEGTQIALAFAGDSDTAKAEIERQAEERRKEIQRREFKAKKEQAVFNIAIDTAQAIIAIWAQVPKFDFGVSAGLLSAFVGALGLAQIAMVSSQQMPAYKMGTDNHGGGAMLVNDGSGSNYKETIQTPDGKIYQPKERNVIMNAPKGTKVFTHDQWQRNLDNILTSNSINYSQPNVVVNSGMSDEQVDRIVSTIANKQESHLSLDKSGIKHYVSNGHTTKEILNNQVTFGR